MKKLLLASLLILGVNSVQAKQSDLELAYQKEFAFLKAQKRSLENRLTTLEQHNKANLDRASTKLDQLQAKLLGLDTKVEKKAQKLLQAERDEQDISDNGQIVDGTLMQAKTTLGAFDFELNEKVKNQAQEMKKAFAFGSKQITALTQVRTTKGSFFLLDGTKVDGDIVKVGNVASYGITTDKAVALVPAGGGLLKAWNQPAVDTAKALKEGKKVDALAIFIYESSEKEIDAIKGKTALSVINSGGAIGWVIVALGGFALFLVILRVFFLRGADSDTATIRAKVVGTLLESGEKEALKVCKKAEGATARVLAVTIRNLDREREHLEDIVAEAVLHENNSLDKFGSAIMVVAAVAPLLGLLGTVTGMISTFDIITEFGTGDPKMLSGGISEALVTTELGLIVAIPALLFGNLLSSWSERIKDHMEQAALHVTNIYLNTKND